MFIASTNATDVRDFPTVTGAPRSFSGFPLKFTWSPGVADALSMGILGWVVAQPKIKIKKKLMKITGIFIANISPTPFPFALISSSYG